MNIESFLSGLDKVKPKGAGKWMASCPCHEDKTPSLAIKDNGGLILIHCFSQQCSPIDICAAINFELSDLFPPSDNFDASTQQKHKRTFFDSAQVLESLAFESLVLQVISADMLKNGMIDEESRGRLVQAANRIRSAVEYTKKIIYEKRN